MLDVYLDSLPEVSSFAGRGLVSPHIDYQREVRSTLKCGREWRKRHERRRLP